MEEVPLLFQIAHRVPDRRRRHTDAEATRDRAGACGLRCLDVALNHGLENAPFPDGDGTDSARATLVAFVNGRTGAANPQRQGLNSALLDGLDPLNVLAWKPNQGRYSPLWDVHPAQWSAAAVAARANVRQTSVADVEDLVDEGVITGPGGATFGPANFVVDCPIVSAVG